MIHAKSMKDVLFAAMPLNQYFSESKSSKRLWVVFTKKLRFEDSKIQRKQNKLDKIPYVRLFLPSILPQYAIFWENYKHYFENEMPYIDSIWEIKDGEIEFNKDYLRKYLRSSFDSMMKRNLPSKSIMELINEFKEMVSYNNFEEQAD